MRAPCSVAFAAAEPLRGSLKEIQVPRYLLAGEADDITTRELVFDAEMLVGTRTDEIVKKLVPGGQIGLPMGSHTLTDAWPEIGHRIRAHDSGESVRGA